MSMLGRVFGHGFGLFFMVLGGIFLAVALDGEWSNWLDENSTCNGGACADGTAKTTFLIVGVSFVATGLISSVVTEFAVRKTRSILGSVVSAASDGSLESSESIAQFLEPFGIEIDPSADAPVNVSHRTIDLRGQRSGDVPRDPAGLSAYLKSVGVSIDEDLLRNATIVDSGGRGSAYASSPVAAAAPSTADSAELRRESATIVRKRDRGETAGDQRLLELELEVQPAGKVPYRVEIASLVRESLADLLIEGATLNVRVDPSDENRVTVDWGEN